MQPGPSTSQQPVELSPELGHILQEPSSSEESDSDEEAEPPGRVDEWLPEGNERVPFPFNEYVGAAEALNGLEQPIDYFEHFIDDHLASMVALETN